MRVASTNSGLLMVSDHSPRRVLLSPEVEIKILDGTDAEFRQPRVGLVMPVTRDLVSHCLRLLADSETGRRGQIGGDQE